MQEPTNRKSSHIITFVKTHQIPGIWEGRVVPLNARSLWDTGDGCKGSITFSPDGTVVLDGNAPMSGFGKFLCSGVLFGVLSALIIPLFLRARSVTLTSDNVKKVSIRILPPRRVLGLLLSVREPAPIWAAVAITTVADGREEIHTFFASLINGLSEALLSSALYAFLDQESRVCIDSAIGTLRATVSNAGERGENVPRTVPAWS